MIERNEFYLNNILESCEYIIQFIENINFETFEKTRMIQSAVIRELEIIGEATKNLTEDIRQLFKNIPWSKIAGMRDKLIHGYFTVDLNEVWNTSKKDISSLKVDIENILNKKDKDEA